MNGYNFTEKVRRALARAREEAAALRHEYVGTEHILLGILAFPDTVATAMLEQLAIDRAQARDLITSTVRRGNSREGGPDLPYTSRAKKVLELSMGEAKGLHHPYVGTEHLLLGLAAEEKGIAAQVLLQFGATLAKLRSALVTVLGVELPAEASAAAADALPLSPAAAGPSSIRVVLRYDDANMVAREFTSVAAAVAFLNQQPSAQYGFGAGDDV